jgi:alpha-amylase/alpha-mannosidase (GH57 family)
MRSLNLVLLWHMHQPDYRNYQTGEFFLPWVYLHAIKDYSDMACHLEKHPKVHAVVNFVPVLLDQMEDYIEQFDSGQIRDPLLRLLATPDLDHLGSDERSLIMESCFRCNHVNMMQPFPLYRQLHDLYEKLKQQDVAGLAYLSGQYLADLLMWYHLVWTGESVRQENDGVLQLMTKGAGFTYADRLWLCDLIGDVIRNLIPRYRKLAESGQIELSSTTHYHPLSPLLLDFSSAHDSLPYLVLPEEESYPGGRERVSVQLASAITSHARRFGHEPAGIWPAEGAVSPAFLDVLSQQGCRWIASGENVLSNSLCKSDPARHESGRHHYLYHPYRLQGASHNITCFFRDDVLSDRIGFEYARWFGLDAAEDLIRSLEQIGKEAPQGQEPLVSIIMDGENAWEHYPYNGFHFLNDFYRMLEAHPFIRTTTFDSYIRSSGDMATVELPELVAGSWVYGTFSTWIGDRDKNRAWDLLCAAKQRYDEVMQSGFLTAEEKVRADRQLSSCESSDWFWWFGEYNPAPSVESFDRLFRDNLSNLYRLLKLPVPATLMEPVSHGSDGYHESSGTMRRGS